MTNTLRILGFFILYRIDNKEPEASYFYSESSDKDDSYTLYRYLLTEIARIYELDPVFYYDVEGIFIVLDHIALPTYEDFRYELDEPKPRTIKDTTENIEITYYAFSDATCWLWENQC